MSIDIYPFPRDRYILLVVETKDFQPLDIERVKRSYPGVDKTGGVAIAGAPETDWSLVADLLIYYRDRSCWQAAYNPGLHGFLVSHVSGVTSKIRCDVVKSSLPCLQCFRETAKDKPVKLGAKRPYCDDHYGYSPHRSGSRRKKS